MKILRKLICKIFGHKRSPRSEWVPWYTWRTGANGKVGRYPAGRFVPCCERCGERLWPRPIPQPAPPSHPNCRCLIIDDPLAEKEGK